MDHKQFQRPRLDFLHGLRGVLALTVVLFHIVAGLGIDRSRPAVALLMAPIMHGHLAVPAFLVLSGFLLAMPVVLHGGQLPGGLLDFLRRRAIRILPPYYAVYFLSMVFFLALERGLALYGIAPWGKLTRMIARDWTVPSFVSHLFLVHNLDGKWPAGSLPSMRKKERLLVRTHADVRMLLVRVIERVGATRLGADDQEGGLGHEACFGKWSFGHQPGFGRSRLKSFIRRMARTALFFCRLTSRTVLIGRHRNTARGRWSCQMNGTSESARERL